MDNRIKRKICPQCNQEKNIDDFYKGRDQIISSLCKTCILSDIDNNNPDTFLKYLQELDMPYIEHEWNCYKAKHEIVFNRYIALMRLPVFKNLKYSDSNFLMSLGKDNSAISPCFN